MPGERGQHVDTFQMGAMAMAAFLKSQKGGYSGGLYPQVECRSCIPMGLLQPVSGNLGSRDANSADVLVETQDLSVAVKK